MFDALMKSYGLIDYVICARGGAVWFRKYDDGGWLEGYSIDAVIYWGA